MLDEDGVRGEVAVDNGRVTGMQVTMATQDTRQMITVSNVESGDPSITLIISHSIFLLI